MSNDAESSRPRGIRRVVTAGSRLRVEYDRCGVCEQTSLRGPTTIEHAPDCPHAREAAADADANATRTAPGSSR